MRRYITIDFVNGVENDVDTKMELVKSALSQADGLIDENILIDTSENATHYITNLQSELESSENENSVYAYDISTLRDEVDELETRVTKLEEENEELEEYKEAFEKSETIEDVRSLEDVYKIEALREMFKKYSANELESMLEYGKIVE